MCDPFNTKAKMDLGDPIEKLALMLKTNTSTVREAIRDMFCYQVADAMLKERSK